MEYQQIRNFVRRSWIYWVAAVLAGAVLGLVFVKTSKPNYEAILTYEFTKQPEQPTSGVSFYQYDQFYALESANRAMVSFSSWVSAPQIVNSIYTAAGVDSQKQSVDSLRQLVRIVEAKSNILTIALRKIPSIADANRIATVADDYQEKNFQRPTGVTITTTSPLIISANLPHNLVIITSILATLVIVFVLTLIRQYFSHST